MIAGDGPAPSLVLALVQRLPDESLTVALMSGGRHLFGWSRQQAALAEIFDALMLNTRVTGFWKDGKPPELPQFPRPKAKEPQPTDKHKPVSVAALYTQFQGGRVA